MFDVPYDVIDVPVRGGDLRVGRWTKGEGPVLVATHGVTANHAEFHALADALAEELDGFTLLAPDLRGRAGSRDLGAPYGMPAHADDLAALIRATTDQPVMVVGHSMGGFVAVVAAARTPELVREVVLVDGGLPLDLGPLAALPMEELLQILLGPSMDRLRMTFPTEQAYLDYWRPHPSLAGAWSPYVETYLKADLVADGDVLRPSAREEAVTADSESDLREGSVEAALAEIRQPVLHLRAPRGVLDQVPPLYPDEAMAVWQEQIKQLETAPVDDVNHFTILIGRHGATQVAGYIGRLLASR